MRGKFCKHINDIPIGAQKAWRLLFFFFLKEKKKRTKILLLHKDAIKTVLKNCVALLSLSKIRWNAASKRIKVKKIVRLFKHRASHVLLEKHSSKCGGYNIFLNVCHNHYFSS